jgi:hypothetical protein
VPGFFCPETPITRRSRAGGNPIPQLSDETNDPHRFLEQSRLSQGPENTAPTLRHALMLLKNHFSVAEN